MLNHRSPLTAPTQRRTASKNLLDKKSLIQVTADGGEHGVDGVAGAVSEIITAHAVLGLEMADHWLDGGPSPELAFDLRRDAALLTCGKDPELIIGRRVVAAIAGKWNRRTLFGGDPTWRLTR